MTVALTKGMTLEEFLAWDAGQEDRWEFDGFQPVAMVGGTLAHATLCLNVAAGLKARLKGGPCRAFVESVKVRSAGSVRYPDVLVACGALPNAATEVETPVVVFEVLSPSTSMTDHIVKNAEYRATPSIQRYVMLAQDRIAASVYERRGEAWVGTLVTEAGAVLEMPEIGVSLPLLELYEGVIDPGAEVPA